MNTLIILEQHRLEIQAELDAEKTKAERNQLGQFATPPQLAKLILEQARRLLPNNQAVRFLDPALGTGAFFSALLQVFPEACIDAACAYEIDAHYGEAARNLWRDSPIEIFIDDFTKVAPPQHDAGRYNLVICNPPYVRHHHLKSEDKKYLQTIATKISGITPDGLSGLYVYFLCITHAWLQDGGIAGWLIPSEFMDVNYGRSIRKYLTSEVTLLEIHRFAPEEMQFNDALVSSAVVWFRKQTPPSDHVVRFSQGGHLSSPHHQQDIAISDLRQERKWSRFPQNGIRSINHHALRLHDLFDIKRGAATGANDFFIVDRTQIQNHALPSEFLIPILPSPRYLETDEVLSDADGIPKLKQQFFLINCDLPEKQVAENYPTLWCYLQTGRSQGINERYLCRQRPIWYSQDKRQPSPFLCTYMGRQSNGHNPNPFRFILNHSQAIAPNVYLNIYPKKPLADLLSQKPDLRYIIWQSLQSISTEKLIGEGRVYGGGLYKLEPKELGNLLIADIFDENNEILAVFPRQNRLF